MKNILILLILICVSFVSCDGRQSKSVSLKKAIKEFKVKQSKVESINFYPEAYTEVITDTIIANNVKIHIRNYSLDDESILFSSNTKSKEQKKHRVFESEITVLRSDKEFFSTSVSAKDFKYRESDSFWNNATLQHVWLNQELSTIEDLKVDMTFINPTDNSYKLYRMSIDANGKQYIEFIEKNS